MGRGEREKKVSSGTGSLFMCEDRGIENRGRSIPRSRWRGEQKLGDDH